MRATLRRCLPTGRPQPPPVLFYHEPKYPITGPLTEIFGGYRSKAAERRTPRKETHDKLPGKRAEIVSEQLCGN